MTTVEINFDKRCAECGRSGACQNGLCLSCVTKAVEGKAMKSLQGRAVAKRFEEILDKGRQNWKKVNEPVASM